MVSRIGQLEVSYGAGGGSRYRLEIWHDGLCKHRVLTSSNPEIVKRKAALQIAEWEERWSQTCSRKERETTKAGQKDHLEANRRLALERTAEAQTQLNELASVLKHTLGVNDTIDWEQLLDTSDFVEPRPCKPAQPTRPEPRPLPPEPNPQDADFQPRLGLIASLVSSRRERAVAEATAKFRAAHQAWADHSQATATANAVNEEAYKRLCSAVEKNFLAEVESWEGRRASHVERQNATNSAIESQRVAYLSGDPQAITDYCDLVLSRSDYPDYFPHQYTLDYSAANKLLGLDYSLPAPADIPTVKEVKYVASRDEFAEQHLSQTQATKIYDDLLYQIVLRTIHELLEADVIEAINIIVFNGYVTSVDPASGNQVTACVLSLQTSRQEFLAIRLSDVDPKTCFRALKGIGSSKLHSLSAVAPILQLRRDDGRFIAAYDVAQSLNESSNLAAMDWEDFEHLIRELFAAEFQAAGGEVKITQASRDGGVDAVAFDPDPIRGGKIVIQAKRYTNTVSVAAVRDLFGTVMNEGANKGILVTTADFGPDAYSFAKGKPLVLLNGSNLLHLLEKHGHKAYINLAEARRVQHF